MFSLPSTPTRCTGLEVIPTEDGPEYAACLRPCCTGRAVIRQRIAATGDPFLGASVDDDEEW